MATTIMTVNDTKIYVNDKEIIKDIDGDWICNEELTPSEARAFKMHLSSI